MATAIRVDSLGKCYQIGRNRQQVSNYRTLRESLVGVPAALMHRIRSGANRDRSQDFWALRGVDFEIEPGEVVGIIGHNGAGKSTMLKILSRITRPTTGRVELHGRVGSLLEVGTGFHPELTGRENIYLNGAILGMSRREIDRKFDEIVAFAEIGKFLETPVKRYSSGMYVRLAFSVAAHLEPEILLVDEVLAVGDSSFQKKCLGKMKQVTTEGRTVLFVSHNMGSVSNLCQRVLWLEKGRLKKQGPAKSVVDEYMTDTAVARERVIDLSEQKGKGERSSGLTLRALEWLTDVPPRHGDPLSVRVYYEASSDVEEAAFGLGISTIEGTRLLSFDSDHEGVRPSLESGRRGWVELTIDELLLAPGVYSLDVGARSGDRHSLHYLPGFTLIEVLPGPKTPQMFACFPGCGVREAPSCRWG